MSVTLNGVEIVNSTTLQASNPVIKPVTLQTMNTLNVALKGTGGTFITVTIEYIGAPLLITDPRPGATILGNQTIVRGLLIGAVNDDAGITVNGVPGTLIGGEFVVNHVPLNLGMNDLTATAVFADGTSLQNTLSVLSMQSDVSVTLRGEPEEGLAPLSTNMSAEDGKTAFIISTSVSCSGPELPLISGTGPEYMTTMNQPGIYICTLNATDSTGRKWQDRLGFAVRSKAAFDALLQNKWSGMKASLANG